MISHSVKVYSHYVFFAVLTGRLLLGDAFNQNESRAPKVTTDTGTVLAGMSGKFGTFTDYRRYRQAVHRHGILHLLEAI